VLTCPVLIVLNVLDLNSKFLVKYSKVFFWFLGRFITHFGF